MTSFHIRPRFKLHSDKSVSEIEEKLMLALKNIEATCVGRVLRGHATLLIPGEERHYWSPQLSLSLEEEEEGTLIRGLYGPNPSVWAMFAFGYSALGFMSLFVMIIGFSRMNLGLPAPVLWFLPFFIAGFGVLYLIAQMGQKLGSEQTFTLHHFFEDALKERAHVH